mmetsp:Transcript_56553/g.132660  ORF Transcript_56553/g.132660 Transcript_56553/m.132660 type:complete len:288 (+) Transcript_56553:110-973(+)
MGDCCGKFDKDTLAEVEKYVALAFHPWGIFAIAADGSYKQVNSSKWSEAKVALPDSRGSVTCFHTAAVYSLSYATIDREPKVVHDERWSMAQALVQSRSDPKHVVCFHVLGMFKVNLNDGNCTQICGDSWAGLQAAVFDPCDDRHAYVFHSSGLFRVALVDGRSEKLGSDTWGWVRAAVYLPQQQAALVIHALGVFLVQLKDGSYEKISTTPWSNAMAVFPTRDPLCVMVLDHFGIYSVRIEDGAHRRICKDRWSQVSALAPLGSNVFVSSRPYQPEQSQLVCEAGS